MKLILPFCFLLVSACSVIKNSLYKKFYYAHRVDTIFYTELPFEIMNGFLIVNVKVNGEICRFMVDTGSRSYIKQNKKELLNLIHFDSVVSKDVAGTAFVKEKVKGVLDLGSLKLHDFTFVVKENFNFISDCYTIDGILGNDVLNQGVFYFNYQEKKIVITNTIAQIQDKSDFEEVPIKLNIGDIQFKYKGVRYTLDSGFSNGFILTNKSSNIFNPNQYFKELTKKISGLNGEKEISIIYQEQKITLFNNEYDGIICFTDDMNIHLLGSNWFINNDIILDITNKKAHIRKGVKLIEKRVSSISNISIGFVFGQVIIDGKSPTIKNVHIGDIIQKINGCEVGNFKTQCELREYLKTINYENGITLSILRDNKLDDYYFTKNQLYN